MKFNYSLLRRDVEKAHMSCRVWDRPLRNLGLQDPEPFRTEMWRPIADDQRVMCFFDYFDAAAAADAFALQARMWSEFNIGPVYSNPADPQPNAWGARPQGLHFPMIHIHRPKARWWQKSEVRLTLVYDH